MQILKMCCSLRWIILCGAVMAMLCIEAGKGQSYKDLYSQIRQGVGQQGTRTTPSPGRPPSTRGQRISGGLIVSSVDLTNPKGPSKSQLTVSSADPDYTRLRQLFLNQMCQTLLNGPRASSFQFCTSLL